MAISSTDQLVSALGQAQRIPFGRDASYAPTTLAFTNMIDSTGGALWKGIPGVGVDAGFPNLATTLVTSASANCGVIPFTDPGVGNLLYLAQAHVQAARPGTLLIFDRIASWRTISNGANGGMSGTLAVPNGPDPRNYSGGRGVELWAELMAAAGGSVTLTPTYTNAEGTSGRVGPGLTIPSGAQNRTMWRFGLAAGDRGVRSVQSINSSGTALGNNVLVSLVRQIAAVPVGVSGQLFDFASLGLPNIPASAGLSLAFAPADTSGSVQMDVLGTLTIVEG